jgi:quinol monooxygenase YgiN
MKNAIASMALLVALSTPGAASAQQPEQPITADIIYLYRIPQNTSDKSGKETNITKLKAAMRSQRPDDKIIFLKDLTDPTNYITITQGPYSNRSNQSGWDTSLVKDMTNKLPGSRAFVLNSTLLTGDTELNVDSNTFVVIEHVDSDPKKREMNLPLFEELQRDLENMPGFKSLQVWTWNQRTNHWTVIETWENAESHRRANRSPKLLNLWDKIYGNAAAPNNESAYRLVD